MSCAVKCMAQLPHHRHTQFVCCVFRCQGARPVSPIDGDVGGFKQLTPRTQRGYLGSKKPLAFSKVELNALIDFVMHVSCLPNATAE